MKLHILIIIMVVTPLYSYGMSNEYTNDRKAKIQDEKKAIRCIKETDVLQWPLALEMSGIQNFDCDISQSVQACVLFEQNKYNCKRELYFVGSVVFGSLLEYCIINYDSGNLQNDASGDDYCMGCKTGQMLMLFPSIAAFIFAYKQKNYSKVFENIDDMRRAGR